RRVQGALVAACLVTCFAACSGGALATPPAFDGAAGMGAAAGAAGSAAGAAGTTTVVEAGATGGAGMTDAAQTDGGADVTPGPFREFDVPTPNSSPWGITVGPDGALWFTELVGGKIGR